MFDDGSGDGPMTSKEPAGARCHPRRSRPSLYSSSSRIPSQPSETKAKTSASHGTRRSLPKPCGMLVDAARQPRFAVMLSWSVVFLSVCLSVCICVCRQISTTANGCSSHVTGCCLAHVAKLRVYAVAYSWFYHGGNSARPTGQRSEPPSHQLEGLGEHCKLLQRGLGSSPGRPTRFSYILSALVAAF